MFVLYGRFNHQELRHYHRTRSCQNPPVSDITNVGVSTKMYDGMSTSWYSPLGRLVNLSIDHTSGWTRVMSLTQTLTAGGKKMLESIVGVVV